MLLMTQVSRACYLFGIQRSKHYLAMLKAQMLLRKGRKKDGSKVIQQQNYSSFSNTEFGDQTSNLRPATSPSNRIEMRAKGIG